MPVHHPIIKRPRHSFGHIASVLDVPNLIQVQKDSYERFLHGQEKAEARSGQDGEGLWEVFESFFPIQDFSGTTSLDFVGYRFDKPKYDIEECQRRGITYAAPLKVALRLIVYEVDETTGAKSVQNIKEQEVYMGDLPLMTPKGTFVINGAERVIVSQMHRSPGVFFDHDKGKTHASGKLLFTARVIPYRGSWLDCEFDAKDVLFFRIDRRRKIPATVLLYALGYTTEGILETFYEKITYSLEQDGWVCPFVATHYRASRVGYPLVDAKTGKTLVPAGKRVTARLIRTLEEQKVSRLRVGDEDLVGKYVAQDIVDARTGEVYAQAGDEITSAMVSAVRGSGIKELPVLIIDMVNIGPYIRNTLMLDKVSNREEALLAIYRIMAPGTPPTLEAAEALFHGFFFDSERYDLSSVGRVKMNMRLDIDCPPDLRILRKEDIVALLKVLLGLRSGKGEVDDIDNLGNRRVRSVGELIQNQYRVGLMRMERAIRERMSSSDVDIVMPQDLINARPVGVALREFFGTSQLSQFMDQTNPLAEITHKRRLSALGPGGLTRERAGFEVRDVHPTHYGRICPIETPEGPNIGLINSLASYARINRYGFIESPYRRVKDGKVTDEVAYLSALEESKHSIAEATVSLDSAGVLQDELINCRTGVGNFALLPKEQVDFIDVSPKQIASVATALIPFLENDDANRALMGSNMQRQSVPLLTSSAPLVGTGMEAVAVRDSGAVAFAKRSGTVDQVDAERIIVRAAETKNPEESSVDIYNLLKFQRSNQGTCINQRPLVRVNDYVKAGDIIADGPCTDHGELALGKNVLVAFMPWSGYNFEDSILISERLVRDDVYTSLHIEEFEVSTRDTKMGPEEITRDIPNASEESLRNLDEVGIVYIGANVESGDVLVGRTTPKGETPMTPEEKLLRAIFGERASEVRNTSLKLPTGSSGTVVDVRVFNRYGVEKDARAQAIDYEERKKLVKDHDDELAVIERNIYKSLEEVLVGQQVKTGLAGVTAGTKIALAMLKELSKKQLWHVVVKDSQAMARVESLRGLLNESKKELESRFKDKLDKLQRDDELPPGVMKVVKVYVAVKRKIQPGDKMAGRHGNKGVISRIVPVEDMPYTEDGTPMDIVLNPLGVPSRMNVGQILETHLGWACAGVGKQIEDLLGKIKTSSGEESSKNVTALREKLAKVYSGDDFDFSSFSKERLVETSHLLTKGIPVATPVFDGASEQDVHDMLKEANLAVSGQTTLYDGTTGEPFDRLVTIGYIYMMKLHHLVDDKIHSRSVGPYSLVTQQPLGGKAQSGGQRFGEMEVWALEAYGAAYMLQEMLTVKSDDIAGRTKVYESIVRGDNTFEAGIPESFHVLVKEMQSLGIDVNFSTTSDESSITHEEDGQEKPLPPAQITQQEKEAPQKEASQKEAPQGV